MVRGQGQVQQDASGGQQQKFSNNLKATKRMSKRISAKRVSALKSKPPMSSILINVKRVPHKTVKMSSTPKMKKVTLFSVSRKSAFDSRRKASTSRSKASSSKKKFSVSERKPLLKEEKPLALRGKFQTQGEKHLLGYMSV